MPMHCSVCGAVLQPSGHTQTRGMLSNFDVYTVYTESGSVFTIHIRINPLIWPLNC